MSLESPRIHSTVVFVMRLLQDINWPKNEKKQQEDDVNGYGAECKEDTQEEIEEKALENEKERTWNDMWP